MLGPTAPHFRAHCQEEVASPTKNNFQPLFSNCAELQLCSPNEKGFLTSLWKHIPSHTGGPEQGPAQKNISPSPCESPIPAVPAQHQANPARSVLWATFASRAETV